MRFPQSGGCQCGAIRYQIVAAPLIVYACHCTECQRQSGSAFAMGATVREEHFRITRGSPRIFVRTTDTAKTLACWFCPDCGVRLYHARSDADLPYRNIRAGTLDDRSWLVPAAHFWTRSAQKWVVIPDGVKRFETQPEDPADLSADLAKDSH